MAIREKVWKCSDCGKENLGRHKECLTCASPREKGEMRSMRGQGSSAPAVTDPELLRLARAGSDWFCTHCSAGNVGTGDRCSKCGAPRYAVAEEDHPDFPGAHRRVEGADAKLEREMSRDPREGTVSSEPPPAPAPPPPPRPPPPRYDAYDPPEPESRGPGVLATVALAALAAVILGFIVWAMQTHEVPGSVTAMSWTRTVHVETWTDTTTRLFRKDTAERAEVPPRNGSGESAGLELLAGTCRDEHYKTIQVECGSHQECEKVYRTEQESYSCSKPGPQVECGEDCKDLGNGFEDCNPKYCPGPDVPDTCTRDKQVYDHDDCRDVTDYCDKEILESKCDYRTQEWVSAGDRSTSGSGKDLVWPSTEVGPMQRATYSATTSRTITYEDGGTKTYVFPTKVSRTTRSAAESSANDYLTWNVGDGVVVTVNNLGGIVGEPRRAGAP